jgi:hypothetical protein
MRLHIAGVFADAGALWRSERDLLLRVAGLFYVVPMLGFVLLLVVSGLPEAGPPEKMQEALNRFYGNNLLAIFVVTAVMNFGTFAILNLYLQGGGRTLGEVLMIALRRFVPFLVIDFLASLAFTLGLWLVLPGLFAFARTWLAAPAFAARPEQGVLEAFRQGWRRSGGFVWLTLLGVAAATMLATLGAVVVTSVALGSLNAMAGGNQVISAIAYVAIALVGGLAWTAFSVLRIAAYRLTEPR